MLAAMARKSEKDSDATFDNIYGLTYKEDLLYQAVENIKGNTGSSTEDIDKKSLDSLSADQISLISKKLKEQT
jgi:hypothetical protein